MSEMRETLEKSGVNRQDRKWGKKWIKCSQFCYNMFLKSKLVAIRLMHWEITWELHRFPICLCVISPWRNARGAENRTGWATLHRNDQNTHARPSTSTSVFSCHGGLRHTCPHLVSQLPDWFRTTLPPSVRSNSQAAVPAPVPAPTGKLQVFPRSAAKMCTTVLLLWVLVSFKLMSFWVLCL